MAAIQSGTGRKRVAEQSSDEWETTESYQSLKAFGTSMKVINNDVTKRGIGMLQNIS